jgi:Zn-dependent protease
MGPHGAVKPDPGLWLPLLEDYSLTSLPHDTVLQGTLRPELDAGSPEVLRALSAWSAPAYLHRDDAGTKLVLVFQLREDPGRSWWPHLFLLLATLVTTLGAGALMLDVDPFRTMVLEIGRVQIPYPSRLRLGALWTGAPFALPFLGVLIAHEMGHYVAARAHGVRASLPYFIPFPPYLSVIGTVGAFIRLRSPAVRRSALFDIGAAGPLASFLLSVPLLAVGLHLSHPLPGRGSLATPFVIHFAGQTVWLGNGLATHVLAAMFGPGRLGDSLILLHPLALVGWLGLFVTALNLLPLGQLDGGHVIYAFSPQRHVLAARAFLVALVPMGFAWWGWWVWAGAILLLHRGRVKHPAVIQQGPGIGSRRRLLAWLLIGVFFLTFVPVPLDL